MIDIEWAKRNLTSNMHGVRAHSQLERAQHAKNRQHKLMLMVTAGRKKINRWCVPTETHLFGNEIIDRGYELLVSANAGQRTNFNATIGRQFIDQMSCTFADHFIDSQLPSGQINVLHQCIGHFQLCSVRVLDQNFKRNLCKAAIQSITWNAIVASVLCVLMRKERKIQKRNQMSENN